MNKYFLGGLDMWGNMLATQKLFDSMVCKVHKVNMESKSIQNMMMMALRDEVMEYAKAWRVCWTILVEGMS